MPKLSEYNQNLLIGGNVRRLREEKVMTQKTLAERMEVSVSLISRIENGLERLTINNLVGVCAVLGVSADEVIRGVGA